MTEQTLLSIKTINSHVKKFSFTMIKYSNQYLMKIPYFQSRRATKPPRRGNGATQTYFSWNSVFTKF